MRQSSILAWRRHSAGFTLIELITTIAITALLSGLFIAYSSGGRERLTLYREQARLLSVIYRAKSLSIETYAEPNVPCAFGVNLDILNNRYRLFRDIDPACPTANRYYVYDGMDEVLLDEDYSLPTGFTLSVRDSGGVPVSNLTFVPPDPNVYLSNATGVSTSSQATIDLKSPNGSTLSLRVNEFGQITSL
jgi:prepilin-type N-terminal cleavage/methylation domain-containing protein